MKNNNIIVEKSETFALQIITIYKYLCDAKKEYILSKQLLRSGTSIGANVAEAQYGQSRADWIAKLYISLKEAKETEYWLRLLNKSGYLEDEYFYPANEMVQEILKILISITKTYKCQ